MLRRPSRKLHRHMQAVSGAARTDLLLCPLVQGSHAVLHARPRRRTGLRQLLSCKQRRHLWSSVQKRRCIISPGVHFVCASFESHSKQRVCDARIPKRTRYCTVAECTLIRMCGRATELPAVFLLGGLPGPCLAGGLAAGSLSARRPSAG